MRLDAFSRSAALALVTIPMAAGCVTTTQVGTRSILHPSAGPSLIQDVNAGAGAGLGDASWALTLAADGAVGVDAKSGNTSAELSVGAEYLEYEGTASSSKHGNHIGLYGGGRVGLRDGSDTGEVFIKGGHAFVLDVSRDGKAAVTALSLDLLFGVSLVDQRSWLPTGSMIGIGVSIRHDEFSEWRFKF